MKVDFDLGCYGLTRPLFFETSVSPINYIFKQYESVKDKKGSWKKEKRSLQN